MPWAAVRSAGIQPGSGEEQRTVYLCDWPGCVTPAAQALGCVKELGACAALCAEHANVGGRTADGVKPGRHSYRPWRAF